MITPELIDYVRVETGKGASRESLQNALQKAGWAPEDVNEAFLAIQAPAVSPPRMDPPEVSAARPHSRAKLAISALIVVVVLGLAGVGAAFYSGKLSLPFGLSFDENISQTLIKNTQDATSAGFDLAVNFKMKPSEAQANPFAMVGLDLSSVGIKMKGASGTIGGEEKSNVNLTLKAAGMEAEIEFRVLDKVLYMRLVSAPGAGFLNLAPYVNKWYSFDLDNKNASSLFRFYSGDAGSWELAPEEKEKIKKLTEEARFITILEKNGAESIGEVMTRRYKYDLDRAGISDYLFKLKALLDSFQNEKAANIAADFDPELINEGLAMVKNFQGEVWVGKKDKLPYKVVVSLTIEPPDEPEFSAEADMSLFFSDWDKPVVVEKPEGAQKFEDLINTEMQTANDKSADAAVKAHLANLRVSAELYYDSKYNYDTNSGSYKGFCLSPEAKSSLQAADEKVSPGSVTCKDSASRYIISAPLKDGTHYCADSTPFGGVVSKAPTGMTCN